MVILTVDMCPLWQMNSGVQASTPDSCHSTTEDSSKLQQMVRLIWPSTAILKDQLANCCDGGMKIGNLFRARGGKHKCFGIQSLNWYGKTVSNYLPSQIHDRVCWWSPIPQIKAVMENIMSLASCAVISSMPLSPEMHTCSQAYPHMHTQHMYSYTQLLISLPFKFNTA